MTEIKRVLAGTGFICLFSINSIAQFNDYRNYPVTVTPRESKDSTRGHFWGYMFGSYYTKLHADSEKLGNTQYSQIPKGANAFSLQRLYLGYDYFFNKQFSVHAVMAHEENADDAYTTHITVDQYYNRIFYLKYANMEWDNIFPGSRLTVGINATPSFAITEEPFWGYRSIDRTIMDMKGVTGSNDMGAELGGKFWSKKDSAGKEDFCVGYNFMVGNGLGAVPDNYSILNSYTIWKKYYGDFYIKALHDKLVLDLYGDGRTMQLTPYHVQIYTSRIFLGYKARNFNISAEYFKQIQKNYLYIPSSAIVPSNVSILPKADSIFDNIQSGISIMAAVVVWRDKKTSDPKLSVFARFDMYNPEWNYNPNIVYGDNTINSVDTPPPFSGNSTENYFTGGVDFQPIKQIHIMPNIWYDAINDRDEHLTPREHFDIDLVARVTFYYQFFKN